MTAGPPPLQDLLADHDTLLAAIESPAIWNRVLRSGDGDPVVAGVHVEAVGTGQVASCTRVRFRFEEEPADPAREFPASVVVKTGSTDPTARATSAALRHPEVEVGFYSLMAASCLARTPRCHLAAVNDRGDDFVLVLEDMAGSSQGDQIEGMDPEDVATALDELADLHATWWGGAPEGTEGFIVGRGDPSAHAVLLGMLHEGFAQAYGERLEPEVTAAAERLVASAARYLVERPGPLAVTHGDFRPDNLLVPGREGGDPDARRVAVVDWQTVTLGPAMADVSYFLGGAMEPGVRREHEAELLGRYRARLAGHGIPLATADLQRGYRRYALDGLVMAIGASQVVGRTERGDEMFCAMARRSALHALEAGSFEDL